MALVGGGGAGNTAGSNPSGIGSGINYLGDHVYANSGVVEVGQAETSLLDFFTSSNSYILAHFQIACDNQVSDNYEFHIKLDGQEVWTQRLTETVQDPFGTNYPIEMIIPGQTRVELTLSNVSQDVAHGWVAVMRGRVYYA